MEKGNKIYVGRLSSRTERRDLEDNFSKYGKIRNIDIRRNYAFIEFEGEREAKEAVERMDRKEIDNHRIIVEMASPNKPRSRGPTSSDVCYNCGRRGQVNARKEIGQTAAIVAEEEDMLEGSARQVAPYTEGGLGRGLTAGDTTAAGADRMEDDTVEGRLQALGLAQGPDLILDLRVLAQGLDLIPDLQALGLHRVPIRGLGPEIGPRINQCRILEAPRSIVDEAVEKSRSHCLLHGPHQGPFREVLKKK